MTHGAKNDGSFSEMMGPSISNHSWHLGSILYLHTDTDTCMHICLLAADYTVKPVLSCHSKKKTNYRLMQVKSIAECSKGTFMKLQFVIKGFFLVAASDMFYMLIYVN